MAPTLGPEPIAARAARGAGASRVRTHLVVAGSGLAILAACALVARDGEVGPAERRAFRWINDLPDWLYRPMWLFQQAGNLVIALAIVLVIALLLRSWRLALAGIGAVAGKLALERVVKAAVERRRPGTTIGDIVARGEVPLRGFSFVSGHAVITAAVATILMPLLPGRWRVLPWIFVALNGFARIYVGAHNPLDIVGGIGLGLFIGALLNLVLEPTK